MGLVLADAAAAQERVSGAGVVETTRRRIENISPRSGPAGTLVRVDSRFMPAITPVRIGIGATRTGFEALAELLTTDMGTLDVTVPVPDWVRWDRAHLFIVFDFYFAPIALSNAFHVTNAEGLVHREGRLVPGEGPCPVLRDGDGLLYSLVGDSKDFPAGTDVIVEGPIVESTPTCPGENVIRIVDIRSRGDD
jgi:hypothetical protein